MPRLGLPVAPPVWILLAILLGVLAYVWTKDDAPPDVSDLAFTPLHLPDDENFVLLLLKLSSKLDSAQSFASVPSSGEQPAGLIAFTEHFIEDYLESPALDREEALALANALRPWVLAHRDVIAAAPRSQFPIETFADNPHRRPLRHLIRHLRLAADIHSAIDQPDEAAEIVSDLLETARRLVLSGGSLNDYLVGIAIQHYAALLTLRIAAHPELSATSAQLLLNAFTPDHAALREGYIQGLHHSHATLHAYLASQDRRSLVAELYLFPELPNRLQRLLAHRLVLPLTVKPNRTLHDYAQFIRRLKPLRSDLPPPDDVPTHLDWTFYLPSNFLGRIVLYRHVWMSWATLPDVVPHVTFTQEVIRTYLALHQHRRVHGAFPDSLAELTPHPLADIPREPGGQGQLIYDPVRAILASPAAGPDRLRESRRPLSYPLAIPLLPETAP